VVIVESLSCSAEQPEKDVPNIVVSASTTARHKTTQNISTEKVPAKNSTMGQTNHSARKSKRQELVMRVRIQAEGQNYTIYSEAGFILCRGPLDKKIKDFIGERKHAFFKAIKHKSSLILQSEVGGWYGP
jgi:hypothetical protein